MLLNLDNMDYNLKLLLALALTVSTGTYDVVAV